ncbi:MAG: ABC transporter [Thermoprotei archaeon]|nr:MAG: ABC transporter [Thermoprotei archaeon]
MEPLKFSIEKAGYRENKTVLRNVCGKVNEGETILITGPSGSGKTTLLLAITGVLTNLLEGWVYGKISIAGINPLNFAEFTKIPKFVGTVLQDPDKQLAMPTPWDEVSFILENLGYSEDEIKERVSTALSRFGLFEKAFEHIEHLSGGEKRRLTFASAIVHQPPILILDEPTASVDPWGIREIKRFIRELKNEETTTIVIEHKIKYFLDDVDKILVMNSGKLEKVIEGEEIYSRKTADELIKIGIDARPPIVESKERRIDSEIVLEVDSLEIGYNENKPLIRDISFDLRKGEIVALIGPNGCGKTTLLKTLIGALKPLNGTIKIQGQEINRLKRNERFRRIFYVPQQPDYLFLESTLMKELSITAKKTGKSLEELIGLVPWAKKLGNESPYRLSFGQRRWLSIIIAWSYSTSILLLDEPTSGLDYRLFTELKEIINTLRSRKGTSFLVATHDPRIVAELADRVLFVRDGRLFEIDKWNAISILEGVADVF